jgi:hypothetical protein
MKTIFNMLAVVMLLQLTACKDDDPNAHDQMINTLTKAPWVAVSVDHATDGDLTFQYEDFSMVFTKAAANSYDGEFYIANGGYAFPDAFGKWSLSDDNKTIIFDNGRELEATFSGDQLTLDFVVPPPTGGRVEGLSGHFTFLLAHP